MNGKLIGLVLLTLGIGITGATGAALSTDYRAYLALEGDLKFAEMRLEEAHEAWCEARVAAMGEGLGAEGALADKCEVEGFDPLEEVDDSDEAQLPSMKRILAIDARVQNTEELSEDLLPIREEWIRLWAETVPRMQALEGTQRVTPERRVSQWVASQGGVFGFGLLLVLGGALVSRRAIQSELSADKTPEEGGAVDFGQLLGQIVMDARSIRADMHALEAPTVEDLDRVQVRLERLQKEDLERLLGSGPRLQIKYGIGPFAEIFTPLAGGERRLNRLWSTLVDRHWPEAMISIDSAVGHLEDAESALLAVQRAS
jgi:hypothetical protein